MTKSIEEVIGIEIVLVPVNVGSPVLGDTLDNLKTILDRVVELVGTERDLFMQNKKYGASSPFARGQNPYNPLRYRLQPISWFGSGLTQEYFDQRISIYNHVLELVEETRGNFCSGLICDFISSMKQYMEGCERSKKELQKASEWSEWLRSQHAIADKVFAQKMSFLR